MVGQSRERGQVIHFPSLAPKDNRFSSPNTASKQEDVSSVLEGLCSKSHLSRDRAIRNFETSLQTWSPEFISTLQTELLNLLASTEQPWESVYGAIEACRCIILSATIPNDTESSAQFSERLLYLSKLLIKHTEARVRQAVSSLIGAIARKQGRRIWDEMSPILLAGVASNFDLDEAQRLREASRVAARDLDEAAADKKMNGLRMVHETEGWRGLETTFLAIGELLDGCGSLIFIGMHESGRYEDVDGMSDLIKFIQRAKDHPNRFVREAGLRVLNSISNAAALSRGSNTTNITRQGDDSLSETGNYLITRVATTCKSVLAEGLQDNWSQVRFAASVAARTILKNISLGERREFYPILLPRMCLNRHYVAEGVRNYSQETWRSVIGSDGRPYLLLHLTKCMDFYETQCNADNHAVREAACQTLAEATIRLDRSKMAQCAPRIAQMLLNCFRDESWPVRDHACRALSAVIATFPKIVDNSSLLPEAAKLFEDHLSDNITSIRANCANAIIEASLAYPDSHQIIGLQKVAQIARQLVEAIQEQKENTTLKKVRNTHFGASTIIPHDHGPIDKVLPKDGTNIEDEPTNRMLYSCGSLAPKLRRGSGCMDHGFSREREGWEKAEGGVLVWQNLMKNGERGRSLAEHWFKDIVNAGVCGAEKRFHGKSKWITVVIESIMLGFQITGPTIIQGDVAENGPKEETEDQLLGQIVRLLSAGKKEEGAANRASAECTRIVRGAIGLRRYSQIEREVRTKIEK